MVLKFKIKGLQISSLVRAFFLTCGWPPFHFILTGPILRARVCVCVCVCVCVRERERERGRKWVGGEGEGEQKTTLVSPFSYLNTNLFRRTPLPRTSSKHSRPPNTRPSGAITLGSGHQHVSCGGTTDAFLSVSIHIQVAYLKDSVH